MVEQQRIPLLEKPALGQPCNGCGHCCRSEVCSLALRAGVSSQAPCAALVIEGAEHRCGLLLETQKYLNAEERQLVDRMSAMTGYEQALNMVRSLWASALGAGMGCDSDD